jgi:hypothetical protein
MDEGSNPFRPVDSRLVNSDPKGQRLLRPQNVSAHENGHAYLVSASQTVPIPIPSARIAPTIWTAATAGPWTHRQG